MANVHRIIVFPNEGVDDNVVSGATRLSLSRAAAAAVAAGATRSAYSGDWNNVSLLGVFAAQPQPECVGRHKPILYSSDEQSLTAQYNVCGLSSGFCLH